LLDGLYYNLNHTSQSDSAWSFMKTHSQPLITAICTVALFFTGAALAQEPSRQSQTAPTASVAPRKKAIVYHNFGSPDVLRLEEIEKPVSNEEKFYKRRGVRNVIEHGKNVC
jgi:hypothetical protein